MKEKWEDKTQVKKGNFAEKIVHSFLESKNYVVYVPTTDGAHTFDRLAIKDKEHVLIAEIKAKPKLNNYDETGFEYRHYLEYKKISNKHQIPVFIFFVDEMLKEIYGNFLDRLEKNSRKAPWGEQILFKMSSMYRHIYDLNEEDVDYLKKHSTRNYEYK